MLRLVGMVLAEQDDEWQDGRRYFSPESMALIDAVPKAEVPALLMASRRDDGREEAALLHHELGLDRSLVGARGVATTITMSSHVRPFRQRASA